MRVSGYDRGAFGGMQFDVWGKKNFAQELRLSFAGFCGRGRRAARSEEHTSELQSLRHLVCRLLLEKKKKTAKHEAMRPCLWRLLVKTSITSQKEDTHIFATEHVTDPLTVVIESAHLVRYELYIQSV